MCEDIRDMVPPRVETLREEVQRGFTIRNTHDSRALQGWLREQEEIVDFTAVDNAYLLDDREVIDAVADSWVWQLRTSSLREQLAIAESRWQMAKENVRLSILEHVCFEDSGGFRVDSNRLLIVNPQHTPGTTEAVQLCQWLCAATDDDLRRAAENPHEWNTKSAQTGIDVSELARVVLEEEDVARRLLTAVISDPVAAQAVASDARNPESVRAAARAVVQPAGQDSRDAT